MLSVSLNKTFSSFLPNNNNDDKLNMCFNQMCVNSKIQPASVYLCLHLYMLPIFVTAYNILTENTNGINKTCLYSLCCNIIMKLYYEACVISIINFITTKVLFKN